MSGVQVIKCSYSQCPTHHRIDVRGEDGATLIIQGEILHFWATDCLLFHIANGYMPGHVLVGKAPHPSNGGN